MLRPNTRFFRFALLTPLDYDSGLQSILTNFLDCDGCGQPASPEHIARRLQRLEWATRYRPVHIGAILLGGVSPESDRDFLYAGKFEGEARRLLEVAEISPAGKSPEIVLSEFQRIGFFLTHVLECPLETGRLGDPACEALLRRRASQVLTRIRRSLKPKRVVLISELLAPLAGRFSSAEMGCSVLLDGAKPFGLDSAGISAAAQHLREALRVPAAEM
ncbi:MAG TPA: hypothetical protein VN087_21755 [Verrucomicrobiae bacterium]|jgi:hypothetical protein|nr:hypothetical protein [Verrucomicrobiae bacterium]